MNLSPLVQEVKKLAVETGAFLHKERKIFNREAVETKGVHDYVSYVDRESELRVVKRLKELLPEAGFLTEEGTATYHHEELFWVIDPLDGTTNYIHDSSPYCVSIALRSNHEVVLGVVYECSRNELFWAIKGGRAHLNEEIIEVSSTHELRNSFIALGLPYNSTQYHATANKLINTLYGRVSGIRILGAAAVELCYVAAGRFDARIEGLLNPWDYTAAMLILQQAGGGIYNFGGGSDLYNGHEIVATNGKIDSELLKIIQSAHIYPTKPSF